MTVPDGRAERVEVAVELMASGYPVPLGKRPVEKAAEVELIDRSVVGLVYGLPVPVAETSVERARAVVEQLVKVAPTVFVYNTWPDEVVEALVERRFPLELAMTTPDIVETG